YCPACSGVLESIDVVDKQRAARREALPKERQGGCSGCIEVCIHRDEGKAEFHARLKGRREAPCVYDGALRMRQAAQDRFHIRIRKVPGPSARKAQAAFLLHVLCVETLEG